MPDPPDKPDKKPQRPNLLVVIVDCLRADRCPTTGGTALKAWTRLRDGGVAFSQTISSAGWTPVCFGSLLSGQYAFVHGVRTIRGPAIEPHLPTIATVLQQAGYSTHAFLTGPMLDVLGMNRGFDEYDHRPRDEYVYGRWGEWFAERYRDICSQRRPWLTMLHLLELHCPRQTNGLRAAEHSVREYDLAWRQLDAWIDALLAKTPENTVVALTADHGESIRRRADRTPWGRLFRKMREHFNRARRPDDWRRHGYHVFDEIVRIPWVLAGPDVPRGVIVNDQVRQIDIAPTLLDLLGLTMPAPVGGRSVLPLMHGRPMEELAAYVESGCDDPLRDWHGLREAGWKYAEHPRTSGNLHPEAMLFDLAADPDERRNVIDSHPDVAIRMRRRIDEIVNSAPKADQPGRAINQDDLDRLTEQLRALGYL